MKISLIKKFTLLSLTLLSNQTFADNLYLKGIVGLNTINPLHISDGELRGKSKLIQTFPLVELGIGCRVNERIRSEIVFDYYFLFNNRETSYDAHTSYDLSSKTKINALFLNAYLDVLKFNKVSLFLGGGIGASFQKEKVSGYAVNNDIHHPLAEVISNQANKFAYKLTVGLDFKLSDSVNMEVSYNYFDLGHNRPKIGAANIRSRNYQIHNIAIGLRYSL